MNEENVWERRNKGEEGKSSSSPPGEKKPGLSNVKKVSEPQQWGEGGRGFPAGILLKEGEFRLLG